MALSENLSIGQITPNFSGKSLQGEVVFHEWLNNSWGVLMFYPGAFTPICTTEMCSLTKKHKVCHLTEYLKPSFITYFQHYRNFAKGIAKFSEFARIVLLTFIDGKQTSSA